MRGFSDVLDDVEGDLRDYQPLVDLLPERKAIYQGYPAEDRDYPIELTITPIPAGSTPHNGLIEREYRLQITVTAERAWLEGQEPTPGGLNRMTEIMSRVGERLDKAKGIQETARGGGGTVEPTNMEDGRLAFIGDWRVVGFYDDPGPHTPM